MKKNIDIFDDFDWEEEECEENSFTSIKDKIW